MDTNSEINKSELHSPSRGGVCGSKWVACRHMDGRRSVRNRAEWTQIRIREKARSGPGGYFLFFSLFGCFFVSSFLFLLVIL
jgi:hypothetical protein